MPLADISQNRPRDPSLVSKRSSECADFENGFKLKVLRLSSIKSPFASKQLIAAEASRASVAERQLHVTHELSSTSKKQMRNLLGLQNGSTITFSDF